MSDTDSLVGQSLSTHLLYKVKHPISTLRQSSVRSSFILFFGDQVFASQIQNKEEIFWVTPTIEGPALSLPSLGQSQTPDQHIKTVQCPKQLYSFSFGDQVFASQIQTKEEVVWVTPTPQGASFKSSFSCTKSNTRSAH